MERAQFWQKKTNQTHIIQIPLVAMEKITSNNEKEASNLQNNP